MAYDAVDPHTVAMILKQIEISREFHQRQLPSSWQETSEYVPGVTREWVITLDCAVNS
jgi:histidinol dehydrogenase